MIDRWLGSPWAVVALAAALVAALVAAMWVLGRWDDRT